MIKLISIVIIFFGILLILGGLNTPGTSGGLDFGFLIGVMLAIVGALIFLYDPVEDMKNRMLKVAEHAIRDSAPEGEMNRKASDAQKEVQHVRNETKDNARKKINALAKEVQKMTE